MRFFKLLKAELKKIILRPAFYIMLGFIVVSAIVSSFLFSPVKKPEYVSEIEGTNISSLYSNFTSSIESTDNMVKLNNEIQNKYKEIVNYNKNQDLKNFQARIDILDDYFDKLKTSIETANWDIKILSELSVIANDTNKYLDQIKYQERTANYLITTKDFNDFKIFFKNIKAALPASQAEYDALNGDREKLVDKIKYINSRFYKQAKSLCQKVNALNPIKLSDKFLTDVKASYIDNSNKCLKSKASDITKFYNENYTSTNSNLQFNFKQMLNDYKAIAKLTVKGLEGELTAEILTHKSGSEQGYLFYETTSLYKVKEDNNQIRFMLQNEMDYTEMLSNFNFNQNSGTKTNMYDFGYYLSVITNFVIMAILIYFACILFAGEKHDGQIRMSATKPCSRAKLYAVKILTLLLIGFVLTFILSTVYLIVGLCIYGSPCASVVAVFASSAALQMPAYIAYLFSTFLLYIQLAFYISLACFISILFSSPIFALATNYVLFGFGIVTSSMKLGFVKFFPFVHGNLGVFFGGGITENGFLSNIIYGGANVWLSLSYLIVTFAAIIIASIQIFKRQDL